MLTLELFKLMGGTPITDITLVPTLVPHISVDDEVVRERTDRTLQDCSHHSRGRLPQVHRNIGRLLYASSVSLSYLGIVVREHSGVYRVDTNVEEAVAYHRMYGIEQQLEYI